MQMPLMLAWSPDPGPGGRPKGSKKAIVLGPATGAARRPPVPMTPLVCGVGTGSRSGCAAIEKTQHLYSDEQSVPDHGGRGAELDGAGERHRGDGERCCSIMGLPR